ncbi:exodeoxyribonuclease-like [Dysidea avara]|uniref:exodeoxyribonuclease-like n=1 Tax=Dysidea avara TaxID=196820 RepID=UPI0033217165
MSGRKRKGSATESSPAGKRKRTPKQKGNGDSNELKIDQVSNTDAIDCGTDDFTPDAKNASGVKWNLKICSWNVNGIRAWMKKGGVEYLKKESADVYGLQEVKCSHEDMPESLPKELSDYHCYWYPAEKKGYSGTGLLTKVKPLKVTYGMGIKEHDDEGRLIVAEYDNHYIATTYVPNAGEGLKRLLYRQQWNADLRGYLKKLDQSKPVICCGDMNVAHHPIDLARPKSNEGSAGFTKEERDDFTDLLVEGFVDSFRHLYPDRKDAYSYWSYRANSRSKNVGWRLDYFVLSKKLLPQLCDCIMKRSITGSDHCPVVLLLATSTTATEQNEI